jgi:predicted secreted protein
VAVIAGVGGSVQISSTTVASLNVWTVSAKGNTAKTTVFGTTGQWETEIAAVRNWTAKADGYLNDTDTNGQVALINGLNSTFTVTFNTGDSTHNWSGTAILTGIDPKADVASVETVSFSFNGVGALTFS